MMTREQEIEIAKADYLINSFAIIHGIESTNYDMKMKVLKDLKVALTESILQYSFDPSYLARKRAAKSKKQVDTSKLLSKLGTLGK